MQDLTNLDKNVKAMVVQNVDENSRWSLARTCSVFYNLMRDDLLKQKIYDLGIFPMGILDTAFFRRHKIDYMLLYQILKRADAHVGFPIFHFPYTIPHGFNQEWRIAALLGMKSALDELITTQKITPDVEDLDGHDIIDYLIVRDDPEILSWFTDKHNPYFNTAVNSRILIGIMAGSERTLRWLLENKHHEFSYDFPSESPAQDDSVLHMLLLGGCKNLFWEQVEAGADLTQGASFPVFAARYKHWDICDKLIERGVKLTENDKARLVCYAARDDHQRFVRLFEANPNIDFSVPIIGGGDTVFDAAAAGGQIETIEYLRARGLFTDRKAAVGGVRLGAKFGQLEVIRHLHKKHSNLTHDDTFIFFDYAAGHGDWKKFLIIWDEYGTNSNRPPIRISDNYSVFNVAVESGHVYFAQQFILKYGTTYFEGAEALIEAAEKSENCFMQSWIYNQLRTLKLIPD
ncbi:MAG: ankyrin repeat domain-containing protein, partial [Bacteroidota bacterium]|nr:ankyrin repeat domain-containing protein [Bacteroidota bacterium]